MANRYGEQPIMKRGTSEVEIIFNGNRAGFIGFAGFIAHRIKSDSRKLQACSDVFGKQLDDGLVFTPMWL